MRSLKPYHPWPKGAKWLSTYLLGPECSEVIKQTPKWLLFLSTITGILEDCQMNTWCDPELHGLYCWGGQWNSVLRAGRTKMLRAGEGKTPWQRWVPLRLRRKWFAQMRKNRGLLDTMQLSGSHETGLLDWMGRASLRWVPPRTNPRGTGSSHVQTTWHCTLSDPQSLGASYRKENRPRKQETRNCKHKDGATKTRIVEEAHKLSKHSD